MSENREMTGRRVLVTGAGTGIGRGIGLAFARAGADVVFHYSHSDAGARTAVEEARAMGVRAESFAADFREIEPVRDLARRSIEFLGGVDILVNNAGISLNLPFDRVTPGQFDTLYSVNVRAMFFLTQSLLPDMRSRGRGVVVNISSVHAYEGLIEHSVYAGTKGAIVAYTRELAIELAPEGIRVNAVAPGAIEVESYFETEPEYDRDALAAGIPAGFVGMPDDIAGVVLFLASDAARFIVGQTLVVDGGTVSWMPFSDGFRQRPTGQYGAKYVPDL